MLVAAVTVGTAFALPQTRPQALALWRTWRSEAVARGTELAVGAGLMIPPEETLAAARDDSTPVIDADSLEREIRAMLSDTTSSTAAFIAPGDSLRVPLAPIGGGGDSTRPMIVDPVELARARGSHRRVDGDQGYARVTFAGGIARVRIDGRLHGYASATPEIVPLDSGRHVVSLLAGSYTPLSIELNVQPGDTATAAFRLPPRAQPAETAAAKPPAATPPDTSVAVPPPVPPAAAPPPAPPPPV